MKMAESSEEEWSDSHFDDGASDSDAFVPNDSDGDARSSDEDDSFIADDDEEGDEMLVDSEEEEEEEEDVSKPIKAKAAPKRKSDAVRSSPPPNKKVRNSVSFSPAKTDGGANPLSNFKLTMVKTPANTDTTTNASPVTPDLAHSPVAPRSLSKSATASTPAPTNSATTMRLPMGPSDQVNPEGAHLHDQLKFLWPENIRDIKGRKTTDPNYDPRTLQWSEKVITDVSGGKLTAGKRQWWEIKAQYFDTVLLFKTGKFYEMFHMDADVGVKVLGFNYMKGSEAHAGSPEAAYGTVCSKLVKAGYKVARVEQTETPEQLSQRKKAAKGKKPQVVNREVCSVTTKGTRTYCFMDDVSIFEKSGNNSDGNAGGGPLLIIRESMLDPSAPTMNNGGGNDDDGDDSPPAVCEYGICVVDAIRGHVTLGQFADDTLRSRLHTLLTTMGPSEVIINTTGSDDLKLMVKSIVPGATLEYVRDQEDCPKSTAVDAGHRQKMERKSPAEPWNAKETIEEICRRKYFPAASKDGGALKSDNALVASRWPPVLKACVEGKVRKGGGEKKSGGACTCLFGDVTTHRSFSLSARIKSNPTHQFVFAGKLSDLGSRRWSVLLAALLN